jgi:hypothetical protein
MTDIESPTIWVLADDYGYIGAGRFADATEARAYADKHPEAADLEPALVTRAQWERGRVGNASSPPADPRHDADDEPYTAEDMTPDEQRFYGVAGRY